MVLLTGLATAFFTTKALNLFDKWFTAGKIMFDISLVEINENQLKANFIITNYGDKSSVIQLTEVNIFKIEDDKKTLLVGSQKVNFDHIRLTSNESHLLTNIYINSTKGKLQKAPLFELLAIVDGKQIQIKPFQFYNNLGVYDADRSLAYKNI